MKRKYWKPDPDLRATLRARLSRAVQSWVNAYSRKDVDRASGPELMAVADVLVEIFAGLPPLERVARIADVMARLNDAMPFEVESEFDTA